MKTIQEFGYQVRVPGGVAEARERVEAALKEQGFGVLTEIDVQATLRSKLGVDTAPYLILGVCNPTLAHQALAVTPHVGLMLPCTVTLRQEGDHTVVEVLRPEAALAVVGLPELRPMADEAERRLRAVVAAIEATTADG
jgi:uncharacterized protein (DUF302 family)